MSIIKKRVSLIFLAVMTSMLLFAHSAYAAQVTVTLDADESTNYSTYLYFSKGDVIHFYGGSSLTSRHQVLLALFDFDGNIVDSVLIPPNTDGNGDTYTVTTSGYYQIGLGCGGGDGCKAYGVMEEL